MFALTIPDPIAYTALGAILGIVCTILFMAWLAHKDGAV